MFLRNLLHLGKISAITHNQKLLPLHLGILMRPRIGFLHHIRHGPPHHHRQCNESRVNGTIMCEVLLEENHHRLMKGIHILKRVLLRALTLVMQDLGRNVVVLVTSLQHTITQINILAIHKERLVQQSHFIQRLLTDKHEGTAYNLDRIDRLLVQILHIVPAEQTALGKQRAQSRHLTKSHKRRRDTSTRFWCKRAIHPQHPHTTHASLRILVHEVNALSQGALTHKRVRIQQQHILPTCLSQSLIVGTRETNVFLILDVAHPRELSPQVRHGFVAAVVVHNKHFTTHTRQCLLHREQALLQIIADIVIDYDDGEFHLFFIHIFQIRRNLRL